MYLLPAVAVILDTVDVFVKDIFHVGVVFIQFAELVLEVFYELVKETVGTVIGRV